MKLPLTIFFVALLNLITLNLFGQCPEVVDAGTVTVNDDGGTNFPFVVCFGDGVDMTNNGDFILPTTGPNPRLMFALYTCPPTDPVDPGADPCYDSSFWTGSDFQTNNDGGVVAFLGQNTFWMVPIAADNGNAPPAGPNYDSNGDLCFDINIDQVQMWTFLDEIEFDETNLDECLGEVEVEISGGYEELFPGNYTVINNGSGSLSQSGSNGSIVTITGLADGDSYSFDVEDGNGCTSTFSGGPINQDIPSISFGYLDICYEGSGFPNFAFPAGGTFSFDSPPGDGASIDPFTGEITDAVNDYDVTYTVMGDCMTFDETITVNVLPPLSLPIVNSFYEFCESEDATVAPDGIGDFYTLYENDFTENELWTGNDFDMTDFVNPGEGPIDFYVSQTVGDCESEREIFTVEILSETPPQVPLFYNVCEGEEVIITPTSSHGNNSFEFYGNSSLTDFLFSGEEYIFTPTMNTIIYVTEFNDICETRPASVDILIEQPPTGIAGAGVCDPTNVFYSVTITTNAANITSPEGLVTNNNDGTFTISDIPSGALVDITLISSPNNCTSILSLPEFECSCIPPASPTNPMNQTICTGDPFPSLSVSVDAGVTVDWYDSATNGTLIFNNSTTYTPSSAGTYYAQARTIIDDCINDTRTPVSLTINSIPNLLTTSAACSADLLTYDVMLEVIDATSIQSSVGTVSGGPINYTISGIPVGTDVTYTAFNFDMSCSLGPNIVTSPNCPCPVINPPNAGADQMICIGDPIPALTVSVGTDETADWYDAPTGGNLLSSNSLTYTPATAGTFYAETRNTINNCVSSRVAISITSNPNPTFSLNSATCAIDLLTYETSISITDADDLMTNTGTITDMGGGNYSVSNITSGTDLIITLTNSTTSCMAVFTITAPDCSCGAVNAPMSTGDVLICTGDVIPALEVTVNAGETVDWYDAATAGTLILANSTTYTPTLPGTYYAETRVIADDCISSIRTAVILTIDPTPSFVSNISNCAANLLTYEVILQLNDASTLQTNEGTITNNGGGNFTISGIPSGTDLTYTAFNANASCSFGPETVTAPDCPCPIITAPVVSDTMICDGDPMPTLEVVLGINETADWYDAPNAGNLLLNNSLVFTPAMPGTYFVEARNTINNCVSSRVSITVTSNPIPSFSIDESICSADLLTYDITLTIENADGLSSDAGTVTSNNVELTNFTISDIPVGMDLSIVLTNSMTDCILNEVITAPDCSCGVIAPPVSDGNVSICTGDVIPPLVVNVEAGQTVDWYDAPVDGNLLLANNTNFTPTNPGFYFAETVVLGDGCISNERTLVSFVENTTPNLVSALANCAANLQSYEVDLQILNAFSIESDAGMIVDNGGGNFTITDIPVGMDITYSAFNIDSTCIIGPLMVTAPDCSCPIISAPSTSPDQSICNGEVIMDMMVSVGINQTADWYDSPMGGSLILSSSLNFTPTAAGTYFVEARDTITNCLSERVSITLEINPIPSFIVDINTCSPDLSSYNVTITPTDADVVTADQGFVADNGDGTFTINGIPPGIDVQISLENSITTCTFSNTVLAPDCSCPVIAAPTGLADVAICEGEDIPTFTAVVGVDETVNWYDAPVDGTLLVSNNTDFIPTMAGTYYAETFVPLTGCISDTRTPIVYTINATPVLVSADPHCAQNLLSYSVDLQITNALSIQTDGGTIVDNGGGSFTITNIPVGTDLTYTAFNVDQTCSLGPLTVTAPDCSCPIITNPTTSPDQSICDGELIADMTVTVGFNQSADWYDAEIGGSLLSSASLSFTPTAAGTYYVEARDTINNCVSERLAISLAIHPIPSFVVNSNDCAEDLATYTVTIAVSDANIVTTDQGFVADNGDGTFTISNIPSGIDVQVSLENNITTCTFSDLILAPDCSCPFINAPTGVTEITICEGEDIPNLEAMVDIDETVDWYDAEMNGTLILSGNSTFTPTASGIFYAETRNTIHGCTSLRTAFEFIINENPTLAVTDFNLPTCNEENGDISLEATGGMAPYMYNLEGGMQQDNPSFNNLAASNYNIHVEDANGCTDMIAQNLISPEDVFADAGDPMLLTCAVTTVELDASDSDSGQNIAYQWLDPTGTPIPDATNTLLNVQVAGTYTFMVTNTVSQCSRTSEVIVSEDITPPFIDAGAEQSLTCLIESVTLTATTNNPNVTAFNWVTIQGGNIIGDQNQSTITADATGVYQINVVDSANGCPASDNVSVTELLPEDLNFEIEVNSPTCFGDLDGNILVQPANPAAALLYSLNDAPFVTSPLFNNLIPGSYNLSVEDENGCQSDTLLIIDQGTDIQLVLDDEEFIDLGDSVLLEAITNLSLEELATIQWTNGTGLSCDTCLVTYTHDLQETTLFNLSLVDSLGCTASADVRVFVDRGRHIFVPNAFSPNESGSNDFLMVFGGRDVKNIHSFNIYSRWGESVFEASNFMPNDPSVNWDGKFNGEPLNSGVFVYFIEVEFLDGETEVFTGDIMLMR